MIRLKPIIQELIRNQSWTQSSDYDTIVINAYNQIKNDKNVSIKVYNKYRFLIKEKFAGNDTGIIMVKDNEPICIASVIIFENGVKMTSIGIKPKFRGQNIASIMYDFIIHKYKILYSDMYQSPESRKAWLKLSKKYNVNGYNISTKELFDVSPNEDNTELKSDDPEYNLYKDNNMELSRTDQELKNCLVIIK